MRRLMGFSGGGGGNSQYDLLRLLRGELNRTNTFLLAFSKTHNTHTVLQRHG